MESEHARTAPWWQIVTVGRSPRRTLIRLLVTVTVILLAREFVILPIRVEGISMLPTYRTGKVNFVNRLSYLFHPPQRGDIVAVKMAGESVMLLKRIVGLPGERIGFRRGQLTVNGEPIDEPYLKLPCNWNMPDVLVGPNEYYVVGDNRSMGLADHTQGRPDRKRIVGKVLL